MNYCGSVERRYCYFHPRDAVVGVCAVCLKERLLMLASKQGQLSTKKDARIRRRSAGISLPKVFALGSFLHRLDLRRHRPADDNSDDPESIASLEEDSFISIKFEDNGNARWDNEETRRKRRRRRRRILSSSGGRDEEEEMKAGIRSIVEHAKKGGVLRWRKRIGHLLQLARWKRSTSKATLGTSTAAKMYGRRGGSMD